MGLWLVLGPLVKCETALVSREQWIPAGLGCHDSYEYVNWKCWSQFGGPRGHMIHPGPLDSHLQAHNLDRAALMLQVLGVEGGHLASTAKAVDLELRGVEVRCK